MAWDRPTLQEIVDRVEQSFISGLEVSSPVLRRAVARMISRAVGGMAHMLHGHIQYLTEQIHPDKADEENLTREAALHGVTRNAATFANGTITITGVDTTPIPADTIWVRDDGTRYATETEVTIGSVTTGEVDVEVEAVEAGEAGNLDAGEELSIESPISDVDGTATVAAGDGLTGGTDQEALEVFRARFVEVLKEESLGGSDSDYRVWSKEVAGVTRVWVYRHEDGLGTVKVRFVRDGDDPIIPDSSEVADVQAKLDAERPTTAEVTAEAPVADPMDFEIQISPNNSTNQTLVTNELLDLFSRRAAPGSAVDADLGKILLSEIRTAIGVAVDDYVLLSPTEDYAPDVGNIATIGNFTWSSS